MPLAEERYGRVVLALVFAAQFVVEFVAFSIGTLAPSLRDSLGLNHQQIGLLTSAFFAGAVPACIPSGWLADRVGVRLPLVAVQAVSGLALITVPFLYSYGALAAALVVVGVADGAVMVLGTKALYEWFSHRSLGTAMGIKFLALSLSGVMAGTVPALAFWVGSQEVLLVQGGLILASAFGCLLYRDRPKDAPSGDPEFAV